MTRMRSYRRTVLGTVIMVLGAMLAFAPSVHAENEGQGRGVGTGSGGPASQDEGNNDKTNNDKGGDDKSGDDKSGNMSCADILAGTGVTDPVTLKENDSQTADFPAQTEDPVYETISEGDFSLEYRFISAGDAWVVEFTGATKPVYGYQIKQASQSQDLSVDGTLEGVYAGSIPFGADQFSHMTFCSGTVPPPEASITVVKVLDGWDGETAPTDTFQFAGPGEVPTYELGHEDGKPFVVEIPETGGYTVAETETTGWELDSIACVDDNAAEDATDTSFAGATYPQDTTQVDLVVEDGDSVTCTFTNVPVEPGTARLVVEKTVSPGTATGVDFLFDVTDRDQFGLQHGETEELTFEVPADGSVPVEVTEVLDTTYPLTSVDCGAHATTAIDEETVGGVSLVLEDADDVTCTFVNAGQTSSCCIQTAGDPEPEPEPVPGSLHIVKVVPAATEAWTFDFTGGLGAFELTRSGPSEKFTGLDAGVYSVTETVAPGYELVSIACDDPSAAVDLGARSVAVDLSEGEAVTCTFTNGVTAVLDESVERTPTAPAPVDPTPEPEVLPEETVRTLPRTGAGASDLAGVGLALMLGGALLVLTDRGVRRRMS